MKEQFKRNQTTSKSCFLERFSGKLNVLTKEGEIRDENLNKLPVIALPESRKPKKLKCRTSNQSMSFFSANRSLTSNSSIVRHRAEKYLTQNYDREFADISNNFMKRQDCKKLKKSSINHTNKEPLLAMPFKKKLKSSREHTSGDCLQKETYYLMKGERMHNSDYTNFLRELDSVSNWINEKRRAQKVGDKNDAKTQG